MEIVEIFLESIFPNIAKTAYDLISEPDLSSALQHLKSKVNILHQHFDAKLSSCPDENIAKLIKKFVAKILIFRSKSVQFSTAKEVKTLLEKLYDDVIKSCHDSLNSLCKLPNQVAYAMIQEFIDRIIFAEDAQYQWSIFLNKNKALVWSDFERLESQEKMRQDWDDLVTVAKSKNQRIPNFMTS